MGREMCNQWRARGERELLVVVVLHCGVADVNVDCLIECQAYTITNTKYDSDTTMSVYGISFFENSPLFVDVD